jgi:hypothetical protein
MITANKTCRHCLGLGYDVSGYPCTCVPAKVAKVTRRMPAKTALPASAWRAYLRYLAWAMLLAVAITLVFSLVVMTLNRQKAAESQCLALIKEWQPVGIPKHIKIKCGDHL